jgi:hypothetical protein
MVFFYIFILSLLALFFLIGFFLVSKIWFYNLDVEESIIIFFILESILIKYVI